jgi:hypothetical protein
MGDGAERVECGVESLLAAPAANGIGNVAGQDSK